MARDYKHRTQNHVNSRRRTNPEPGGVSLFKWMLVTALLIGFAVFLVYLKSPAFQKQMPMALNQPDLSETKAANTTGEGKAAIEKKLKEQKPQPPQFDFYTILPKKEVMVPDHEIKTRTREEQVGKNKKANYVIKAGSSNDLTEAEQLKAKLAFMGIDSKIQKAKVESVNWYSVVIGPYSQMGSITNIIARLQKNGMKPVTTEVRK